MEVTMAQRKKKGRRAKKDWKPELPMSKWDFEGIASVFRTKNRKLTMEKDSECYSYNCALVKLMMKEWLDTGNLKDGVFPEEPNKPEMEAFMKSAGCQKYLEYDEALSNLYLPFGDKEPEFEW
jgi:hypothetical protein